MCTQQLGIVVMTGVLAGCGSNATLPSGPSNPAPSSTSSASLVVSSPTTPSLAVSTTTPFHVGVTGDVRYTVSDTNTLASLAMTTIDGDANQTRSEEAPAAGSGTIRLTLMHTGTVTMTITATTMSNVVLAVTTTIAVVP
jgi:hypothetical protein